MPGTGCIPVWGFATVIESRTEGVAVGERFYGYYPMANEVVLHPVAVNAQRFIDGAPHRRELHSLYNQYLRCSSDSLYRPEDEDVLALYRPLFTTSFLIDDFLADNGFFGAGEVLVSSASSKTAYGLGFCLAARRAAGGGVPSIGLTSPSNLAFTAGLGCYDEVIAYADVTRLSPEVHGRLRRHERRRGVARDDPWSLAGPARLQLLGRRDPLGRPRQRQGAGRAAPGALLRARAGQEARRRLGSEGFRGSPRRVPGRPSWRARAIRRDRGCKWSPDRAGKQSSRPIRPCSTARFPPTKAGSWRFEPPIRSRGSTSRRPRPILPESTA